MNGRLKKYIGDRAFYRMALAVAVPIMVQNGIMQFVSLLDNIMVGAVGQMQMGGVGVANQLIVFSMVICVIVGTAMALLSPVIPNLYSAQSEDVRALASKLIFIVALAMPVNSLANACYFTMRSGGKTFFTFLFDSVYACVLVVPMAFFLYYVVGLSILPLYFICQFADLGKCVIGLWLIKKGVWIQNIVKEESHEHKVLSGT